MRFIKTYKYYIISIVAMILLMVLEFYFINKYEEAGFMDYMLIIVLAMSIVFLINDWLCGLIRVLSFDIDSKNKIQITAGYQYDNSLTSELIKVLLYTMLGVFTDGDDNTNKDLIDEIFKLLDKDIENISKEYIVDPIEKKIILNPIVEEEKKDDKD